MGASDSSDQRAAFSPPQGTDESRLLDAGTHPDFLVIRKELARHSANRELRAEARTEGIAVFPLRARSAARDLHIAASIASRAVHERAVNRDASARTHCAERGDLG